MGSEQSSPLHTGEKTLKANDHYRLNMRRQHTIANPGAGSSSGSDSFDTGEFNRGGPISPGPSVCSDVDLPYISYTVNRPIGDSPKLVNKQLIKSKLTTTGKTPSKTLIKSKNAHNVVVVREADGTCTSTDKDPDVQRLQSIPMFLPIMRATVSLPAARDPEVLERLDPVPIRNLCLRYQHHCTLAANLVAFEQNLLTQKVREVDEEINRIVQTASDRQKKFAKYIEKVSKVQELSHLLNRCHMLLNQILESTETLNNHLNITDRLEPFVWTTG